MRERLKLTLYKHPVIVILALAAVFLVGGYYLSQIKESYDRERYDREQEATALKIREAEDAATRAKHDADNAKTEGQAIEKRVERTKKTVETLRREYNESYTRPVPTPDPLRSRDRASLIERARKLGLDP